MDDTARLASELHDKLAELDGKVVAYQRDMLAQFRRHMDDCLKQYPAHVSDAVSRVIAASMSKYPALCPTRRDSADLSPCDDGRDDDSDNNPAPKTWDGRKSPPPILYHTSGTPKEGPRSPHQREKEFQGLFTPSYLPLLDGSYRAPQSPPVSPSATAPTFATSLDTITKVEEPKQLEPVADDEVRPGPIRRPTDRSSSSVESSGSDAKVRRSALRRSSSSAKGSSPRRVRFSFEGAEVLPSSSPQAPVAFLDPMGGAEPEQAPPQALPDPEAAAAGTSATMVEEDESPSYMGTLSLLDVEGEEDSLPRPRKVSSTQALQALSRSPLDAGTTWTVVNPDPDEIPRTNGREQIESAKIAEVSELPLKMKPDIVVVPESTAIDNQRIDELLGSPIEELEEYHDDDASDDEFLSMSTRISRRPSLPVDSSLGRLPLRGEANTSKKDDTKPTLIPGSFHESATAKSTPPSKQYLSEGDTLFDLDEEANPVRIEKYLAEDEEEEDETPISERLRLRLAPTADQPTPPLEDDTAAALPPVSPSTALFGGAVGSYRGVPLTVSPINNAKLYDEIAGMEDVHFVMGSIDGRTGFDPSDMGSYRASLARHVAGTTPRSFTERLALEEAMEKKARGDA